MPIKLYICWKDTLEFYFKRRGIWTGLQFDKWPALYLFKFEQNWSLNENGSSRRNGSSINLIWTDQNHSFLVGCTPIQILNLVPLPSLTILRLKTLLSFLFSTLFSLSLWRPVSFVCMSVSLSFSIWVSLSKLSFYLYHFFFSILLLVFCLFFLFTFLFIHLCDEIQSERSPTSPTLSFHHNLSNEVSS